MKIPTWPILLACLLVISSALAKSKVLELPEIEVVPMRDSTTARNYELYIKLPEEYDTKSDKKHPVIYYTDAMWHVELLSGATAFLMEDAILVGISWQTDIKEELKKEVGDHVSRYRDYSAWKSSNAEHQAKYQFGQASNHLKFIQNDVIKYIESNYKTDINNRTYFGYSLSGFFGAYILLAQPETFKNYIIGSPSVRKLSELKSIDSPNTKGLNANLFISHGSLEEELSGHIDRFIAYLKNKNDKSLTIEHVVIEGSHQTAFPATGVRSVTWLANMQKREGK